MRTVFRATVALVVLALGAGPAAGQLDISSIDVEVRGGVAVPAGDLNEVGATGASFGAGLIYELSDYFSLRLDGDLELLSERDVGSWIMPRTFLWHYHAGLDIDVVRPESSPWRVQLRGGAGATTYDTEPFEKDGDDFIDTYFSVSGGVAVGREVWNDIEIGVVGQAFIVFTDEDRTAELAERSSLLNTFSKASSFPVEIYLRWVR